VDSERKGDYSVLLKSIKPEQLGETGEALAQEEEGAFEKSGEQELAKLEVRRRELEAKSLEQDIEERKKYANKIFWLICVWLTVVLVIMTVNGATRVAFTLSDSVLIALISGVSVNIIALFAIVANYLFPKR